MVRTPSHIGPGSVSRPQHDDFITKYSRKLQVNEASSDWRCMAVCISKNQRRAGGTLLRRRLTDQETVMQLSSVHPTIPVTAWCHRVRSNKPDVPWHAVTTQRKSIDDGVLPLNSLDRSLRTVWPSRQRCVRFPVLRLRTCERPTASDEREKTQVKLLTFDCRITSYCSEKSSCEVQHVLSAVMYT